MPVSAVVAAETVYPVMVNGYLCYSAAEVAAVRRGQSPESVKPGAGNSSSQTEDAATIQAQAQAQAKALAEAQARIAQLTQSADALAQSLEKGGRGTVVDIYT
ncbi:MAG: hypothetical protein FD176_2592 [Rhodospirillaceae bacterium]|nr:MAG: hypothetical protein FD176_2592 [Rhodospirillaceae bacterium]TNC96624.1 MAG: Uncharacterized protein FD119_1509 [Stygiobacter sp.]